MLVREWFVLFTSLAKRDVAVTKLDNVYGSATAMKLCTVALWLPEGFFAIHACVAGFWNASLEASYMCMLQMLVWPGCCCACEALCSAGVSDCAGLHPHTAGPCSCSAELTCTRGALSSLHRADPSAGKGSGWPGQAGAAARAETPGLSGQLI